MPRSNLYVIPDAAQQESASDEPLLLALLSVSPHQKHQANTIALRHLQPIFAPDIADPYLCKQRLTGDLKAISKACDGFNAELTQDILWLANLPPQVPQTVVHLL